MDATLPIDRVIAHLGSQQALADALGIRSPSISEWRARGARGIPAERCLPIERATGGAVTRYELRPDVFGPAPVPQAGEAARPCEQPAPDSVALTEVAE